MSLAHILGMLLGLSVAGNAILVPAFLGARDARVKVIGERDQARSAANICSDATEDLRELADKRHREAQAQLTAARRAAQDRQRRAQEILSAPPSVPGDDCRSADDRARAWLRTRRPS